MPVKALKGTRSDGERTRRDILQTAARLATVEGIRHLSIARLADEVGMSKSGLYAHFGSKEELQLATIDTAEEIYERDVYDKLASVAARHRRRDRPRRHAPRPPPAAGVPGRLLLRRGGGRPGARAGRSSATAS